MKMRRCNMKNFVTLNFKYFWEGREDALQEDMKEFVDNLIYLAGKLNEKSGSFIDDEALDYYLEKLVIGYPNASFLEELIEEVALDIIYGDGEEKVRLSLNNELKAAYEDAKKIYENMQEQSLVDLIKEFGDD